MIRVIFTEQDFDSERGVWVKELLAELQVDGHQLVLSGPQAQIVDPGMSLIDPETGERLTFLLAPERWAAALPSAYRSEVGVEVRVEQGQLLPPLAQR